MLSTVIQGNKKVLSLSLFGAKQIYRIGAIALMHKVPVDWDVVVYVDGSIEDAVRMSLKWRAEIKDVSHLLVTGERRAMWRFLEIFESENTLVVVADVESRSHAETLAYIDRVQEYELGTQPAVVATEPRWIHGWFAPSVDASRVAFNRIPFSTNEKLNTQESIMHAMCGGHRLANTGRLKNGYGIDEYWLSQYVTALEQQGTVIFRINARKRPQREAAKNAIIRMIECDNRSPKGPTAPVPDTKCGLNVG